MPDHVSNGHRSIRVDYDPISDWLYVRWGDPIGTLEETEDDRVLERLDDDDNTLGFVVKAVSRLKAEDSINVELGLPRGPAHIPIRAAAEDLGVSERRVRQLIAEKRITAKLWHGHWMVETPVKVAPVKRGRPTKQPTTEGIPQTEARAKSR